MMNLATKIRQYWDNPDNPSMPDKNLLKLEINTIKQRLGPGKLLDVGCGEGESTKIYAQIKNLDVTGIDYSRNRLKLAKKNSPKAKLKLVDLTKKSPSGHYDYVVSQRFLVNLKDWPQQKRIINLLIDRLNPKGKLILCEGSIQGVKTLNQFRAKLKLKPIPVRWHNVFIDDDKLLKMGFKLVGGFGGYFLLTRGIRPFFDRNLNWNSRFNRLASTVNLPTKYSRIKIWQYLKNEAKN